MFCTEAPKYCSRILAQDNYKMALCITLDPLLVRNIYVDEKHPLKVFIQLEGDCKGIFVFKTKHQMDSMCRSYRVANQMYPLRGRSLPQELIQKMKGKR